MNTRTNRRGLFGLTAAAGVAGSFLRRGVEVDLEAAADPSRPAGFLFRRGKDLIVSGAMLRCVDSISACLAASGYLADPAHVWGDMKPWIVGDAVPLDIEQSGGVFRHRAGPLTWEAVEEEIVGVALRVEIDGQAEAIAWIDGGFPVKPMGCGLTVVLSHWGVFSI